MTQDSCRCRQGHPNPAGQQYCGTCGIILLAGGGAGPPTWARPGEVARIVAYAPHLRRTVATALVIGTVLFCINQLNVVIDGHATLSVWVKTGVTYCVPFAVSNIGILIATHRRPLRPASSGHEDGQAKPGKH